MAENESSTANFHQDPLEIDNLPNRITIFRVLLIPIVIGCLYVYKIEWPFIDPIRDYLGWIAGWTCVLAAVTDFVDGYVARKKGIVTIFGSFLDPVADKFLVVSSLIMLEYLGRISTLIVLVLILREFYMTSLRLLAVGENLEVPVNSLGKWKTTAQMVGIPLLMANGTPWGIPMGLLGKVFIYAAVVLSLYSAAVYSVGLVRKIKKLKSMHKFKDNQVKENQDEA